MIHLLQQFIAAIWNRMRKRRGGARNGDIDLGWRVLDGVPTRRRFTISGARRTMSVAILGKTGTGKSSLLRWLAESDLDAQRGFAYLDVHGDATPFLLRAINARERKLRRHLSDKVILIQPADPIMSVGLNPLEQQEPDFVRIAEFAEILRKRAHMEHFGARTEELLRNSLFVLAANGLTLLELPLLLTLPGFRTTCLRRVANAEIQEYFQLRYDQASEAMRATMREPILNKVSIFTTQFRHIVGQTRSTFSLSEAMDEGRWVIVDLNKGRLGEQALTLGSMILTVLKNALFARTKRSLFTIYCDEIQNLFAYDSGIETMLSEARKFGVGIVSANQYLDQYPAEMRAAILAVGTHVFFQLSSQDASQVAQALDGGRTLAERLKNLQQRHCVVKTSTERWAEICVPTVQEPQVDPTDLVNRVRYQQGRVRAHVEREIGERHAAIQRGNYELLNEWD